MYIDDCTVFGDTDIEFVSRLKLIFERFRKHNLYIKASKCFFGFSELEFVGKVVSEKGLQISRTKIQSILDFPLPTVSTQLKCFLGTANYLRDFVKGYSTLSQPLHQLLTDYNKTRRVVWTPESTAAFHEMKLAISKCTTMHFMSDTAPITLHTDAWCGWILMVWVDTYFKQLMVQINLLLSLVDPLISPNFVGR